LVLVAASAASVSVARSHLLPLPVLPERRLPADWSGIQLSSRSARPRPGHEHGPGTTPSISIKPPINVLTHMRATSRRRPVRCSPRLWPPGWNAPPLGFPPSFAPRRPGAGRRTPGRGEAIEHGPGTTRSAHVNRLQSGSSLNTCDLASHVAKRISGRTQWFANRRRKRARRCVRCRGARSSRGLRACGST
jgi:hypothetical protein